MSSSKPGTGYGRACCGAMGLLVAAAVQSTAVGAVTNVTQQTVHATIQDAIDNAVNGDKIVADDDVYLESIDFLGKAITVTSANGPEACIIEDPGPYSGIGCTFQNGEGRSSVLSGFTIRFFLHGIDCVSSSPSIVGCVIDQNNEEGNGQSIYGGGVRVTGGAPLLSGCTLSSNWAAISDFPGFGGGISLENSTAELVDCVLVDNIAWDHQGVVGDGGGLHVFGGVVTCTGCVFTNNRSAYGGGVSVLEGEATFIECTFEDNTSVGDFGRGGGLWNYRSTTQVNDCAFASNDSTLWGTGGAIANAGGNLTVTGSDFSENRALGSPGNGGLGGALYNAASLDPATMVLSGCRISLNEADEEGGALYCSDQSFGATASIEASFLCGNTPEALAGSGVITLVGDNYFVTGGLGITDFLALLAAWGTSGPLDLDGDGVIGITDFLLLLAGWGTCP